MLVDQVTVENLIQVARRRGRISIDDLRHAFPIDAMDAGDIANIIVRLEDAGISVDIDPTLLSPKHHPPMTPPQPPRGQSQETLLGTGPSSRASSTSAKSGLSATARTALAPASAMSGNAAPAKGQMLENFRNWLWVASVGAILLLAVIWLAYR